MDGGQGEWQGVDAQPKSGRSIPEGSRPLRTTMINICAITLQSRVLLFAQTIGLVPSLSWDGYYDIFLHEPCAWAN